MEIVFTSFTFI